MRHSVIPRHTKDAHVAVISYDASHYLLSVPAGKADQYRLAQLDDYAQLTRSKFPLRPPRTLSLSARTSSDSIPGTWGFGFWNDPFGMSLGFGGNPFRMPALPNAVWFFGASEENYLSFRASTTNGVTNATHSAHAERGCKWISCSDLSFAAVSSTADPCGVGAPLFAQDNAAVVGKCDRRGWRPIMESSGSPEPGANSWTPGVDPTQWHRYSLDWREKRISFESG